MKEMKLNKKINMLVTFGALIGMMFSFSAMSQPLVDFNSPEYYQEQFNRILALNNNEEPSFNEIINYSNSMQNAPVYSLNFKGKTFWFAIPSLRDQLNQENEKSEPVIKLKSPSRDGFI